jgi:hypothetical protein
MSLEKNRDLSKFLHGGIAFPVRFDGLDRCYSIEFLENFFDWLISECEGKVNFKKSQKRRRICFAKRFENGSVVITFFRRADTGHVLILFDNLKLKDHVLKV